MKKIRLLNIFILPVAIICAVATLRAEEQMKGQQDEKSDLAMITNYLIESIFTKESKILPFAICGVAKRYSH